MNSLDDEDGSIKKNWANTNLETDETASEFLDRVSKAPQILKDLITSSLPYLLIEPTLLKPNKSTKMNMGANKTGGRTRLKMENTNMNVKQQKRQTITKKYTTKLQKNLDNSDTVSKAKQDTVNYSGTVARNSAESPSTKKIIKSVKSKRLPSLTLPSFKHTMHSNMSSVALRKTLSEIFRHDNIDRKEKNALRNSSLFSITEKSFLGLNNFDPVEVDTLLLQKLIILDKVRARNLIYTMLKVETKTENSTLAEDKSSQNEKKNKSKKEDLKKMVVSQINDLLLSRITNCKERPAEIFYNVILKLCKKNRISSNNKLRRIMRSSLAAPN